MRRPRSLTRTCAALSARGLLSLARDLGEEAGARPGFAVGRVKSAKTEHGSTNADVLHTDGLMTKKTPLNQASHGTGEDWPGAGCWVFLKP